MEQTAARDPRHAIRPWDLAFLASATLAFGLSVWWIVGTYPYGGGAFDDWDHIPAAQQWAMNLRLTEDSLFLRVPFWHVLLGTVFWVYESPTSLYLLQGCFAIGTLALYLVYSAPLRSSVHPAAIYLPASLFLLSPQVLFYARHAMNEPIIGFIAVAVMVVGRSALRNRGLLLGLLCGVAVMTKVIAGLLVVPAVAMLRWNRPKAEWTRPLIWFGVGLLLIVVPLVALHVAQRGWVLIDTTLAYNLSGYTPEEWWALGDQMDRYRGGMADFRQVISGDPLGYISAFVGRLTLWIVRPSSADFALFFDGYPHALLRAGDAAAFWLLTLFALVGTDRRTAWIWLVLVGIAIACTFPQHTPYSPKIIFVYPTLLLAPYGYVRVVAVIRGLRRRE